MEENVEPVVPGQATPPTPAEWFDIWIKAISSPNEYTYQEIARRADVKTAVIWLAIAYMIVSIFSLAMVGASMLLFGGEGYFGDMGFDIAEGTGLIAVYGCCGILGYTVFGVVVFSLFTALSNAIAKAFGGVGDFRQVLYCTAAYTVPAMIVSGILGLLGQIPCVGILFGLLSIALGIYTIVLNVIAVRAVHQIETWQAILSSVAIWGVILMVVSCIIIAILTLLGPTIGNVFSNVIEGLEAAP